MIVFAIVAADLRHTARHVQGRSAASNTHTTKRDVAFLCVQADLNQAQADERKREKEGARVRRDKLQAARDIEANAEAPNLPAEVRPTADEVAAAQALRQDVRNS